MLRRLLCFLFGPFPSAQAASLPEFLKLLDENYSYIREHDFRILSTEIPDDKLNKWLLPEPGGAAAEEYVRNFARKQGALSEKQLPMFVFDYVLQNRFGRDIASFDETELEAAAEDLKMYVLLLNYISGMRNDGQTPVEFDIFDVENFAAIIDRIKEQAPDRWPKEVRELSPDEVKATTNAIFSDLMDGYIDEIIGVLKEYMTIDIFRCEEVLVRVMFRDMAHFDMNPGLDMRENSCDMFVDKIEYNEDEKSFSLHLTEANVHVDDLMKKPFRWWRKIKRTNVGHHIVIRRGECMTAPYITPSTFFLLKNTVKRYDACERGKRKEVKVMNGREQNEEAIGFINDIEQAADKHGIDLLKLLKDL